MAIQPIKGGTDEPQPRLREKELLMSLDKAGANASHAERNLMPSEEEILGALRKAEETAKVFWRDLKFQYRKEADIYQVEVIDRREDKVVRKIPPDEIVKLIENINKLLGILFDDRF